MQQLETMMETQKGFQTRLDENFSNMTLEERVAFIKEHSIHLNQEINEMLYELPFFKPWKDYSNMTDDEKRVAMIKAKEEMIDSWHFFMNIMLGLGFTAEEFFSMYMAKNKENHRRQDDGYTHDKIYRGEDKAVTTVDSCNVVMDDGLHTSTDFVAILAGKDGDAALYYNTDALTLGMAASMISKVFIKSLADCDEETQEEIVSILGLKED